MDLHPRRSFRRRAEAGGSPQASPKRRPSWSEAKGRTEGGIEGSIRTLWGLVNDHLIDINVASARAHMSVSEFEEKAKALMAEEPTEYKP